MTFLARLFRAFKRSSLPCPKALSHLRSPEQLRAILDRERARADRSGQAFSLLKFVPRDEADAHETLVALATILDGRLRCTDEAGWFDQGQVGVVLPCTDASGARRLAQDVRQSFGELVPPHCEIYCYPSESAPTGDGHPGGRDAVAAPRRRSNLSSCSRCRASNAAWIFSVPARH